jgi:hypothetical protein
MVWTVTTVVIVVVGVLLIVFTKLDSDNSASAAPTIGDHWHAYLGANECGTWLPNTPEFENRANEATVRAGLHSHGDGLMHLHPFSSDESGSKATLGRFLEYQGSSVSETEMKLWNGKQYNNGDTCGTGADAKKAEVQWAVGHYNEKWSGTPRTGNPADYHPKNGDIVALYFLPKGTKLAEPPGAQEALTSISDLNGQPVKGPPVSSTTTPGATVPGATTPSVPTSDSTTSSSTP